MPALILPHSRFLHVPKTGGNWVAAVLRELFPTARSMAKIHTTRNAAPYPDRFTFAFVRHPLTWYQSYFSYKQRKGWDPPNDWDQIVRSTSFSDFLEKALTQTPAYYSRLLRRYVGCPDDEISHIGRFESLPEDLIGALNSAGEVFDPEIIRRSPPINPSDYQLHPAVYSKHMVRRVLDAEAEVIQRFYSNAVSAV